MKAIYSLALSASVLSLISANGEENRPEEAFPSSFSLFTMEQDLLAADPESAPEAEKLLEDANELLTEADLEVQEGDLSEIAALLADEMDEQQAADVAPDEYIALEDNTDQPEVQSLIDERIEIAFSPPEPVEKTPIAPELEEPSIEEDDVIAADPEPALPTVPSIEEESLVGIAAASTTPEEIADSISEPSFEGVLSFAAEDHPIESLEKAPMPEDALPLAVFEEVLEAPAQNPASTYDELQARTDTVIENSKELSAIPYTLDKDAQKLLSKHVEAPAIPHPMPAPVQPEAQEADLISEEEIAALDAADKEFALSGNILVPETVPFDEASMPKISQTFTVDLQKAFSGSPLIYSFLLTLSVGAFGVWIYNLTSMQSLAKTPESLVKNLKNKLIGNQYDEALSLCMEQDSLFCRMLVSGISSRKFGPQVMVESMKTEGKRATVSYWQRISLLNDIAIIAPMLGLLGTVLGMFYAFYDINRSNESVTALFDGLGVSVGTTVAGLVVAILALVLQSISKYRLVKALARVENEANAIASIIDSKVAIFQDK